MQIDHDPKELSHKAIKIVALLAAALIIAVAIPVVFSTRWVVEQLPTELTMLFAGAVLAGPICFFIGRWDAARNQRTPKDG
ncbi:hypothetical protein [Neorhizobium galegae]|uniref:hypothetical protein n=1 Tax=Neorhizobium galegae TaxID=399 RepID=UPI0006275161|nr:hypothetical protein [Neorhizobium galegae]